MESNILHREKQFSNFFCTILDRMGGLGFWRGRQNIYHCRAGDFVWCACQLGGWIDLLANYVLWWLILLIGYNNKIAIKILFIAFRLTRKSPHHMIVSRMIHNKRGIVYGIKTGRTN